MFAHTIFSHQAQSNRASNQSKVYPSAGLLKLRTPLSFAIGMALSGLALQAHAASDTQLYNEIPVEGVLVEADNVDPSSVVDERSKVSRSDSSTSPSTENRAYANTSSSGYMTAAEQEELFFECTEVQSSAARLACYDKVAEQGRTPGFTMNKKPLDIARTFRTTISGEPQIVLAEENESNYRANGSDSSASTNNERLDTVGLTKREAQVLEDAGVTQTDIEKYTALSLAYDLDQNSERGTWTVRPHNPNYILPLFYSFDPNLNPTSSDTEIPGEEYTSNDIRNTELKFQLSLKTKVAEDLFNTRADLWFGYTQQAHWQVYNEDNSRPFRGTDYQPEIFLTQPVAADLPFGGRLRMLGVGAVHHSNGRSDPISRSWNRAYLMGGAEWGKLTVIPRIWARIKNESSDTDDNPDITDYMGYGDLTLLYDLPNQQSISSTLRYNPGTNKGAAQIDYVYPLTKNVNGFVQLFQGYGESLIDYNHENTAIGIGIVLNDWKGF